MDPFRVQELIGGFWLWQVKSKKKRLMGQAVPEPL